MIIPAVIPIVYPPIINGTPNSEGKKSDSLFSSSSFVSPSSSLLLSLPPAPPGLGFGLGSGFVDWNGSL